MKRKRWIILISAVVAILILFAFLTWKKQTERNRIFQFVTIQRGEIKNTITSTGIIHPKSKVEVGTQISGTFAKIYVGYNDLVKKGQLLAEMDKRMLNSAMDEAKAAIIQTREKMNFSRVEYAQKKELYKSGYLSEIDFLKAQSGYYIDSSAFLSATANLNKAITNLEYAQIISPISGTVIEKNVEAGQTVAANFNTPTLFVIAEDLSKVEIHATVDESDISNITKGQLVEFTVLAYPDSIFTGIVDQIRMHPQMIQNVVNYIIVINADNKYDILMPGMTATVDFILDRKKDVLMVPKAAIGFRPPKRMEEKSQRATMKKMETLPDSIRRLMPRPPDMGKNSPNQQSEMADGNTGGMDNSLSSEKGQLGKNISQIWYIDENGELLGEPVETGSSDDKNIELKKYYGLHEGMQVISGILDRDNSQKSEASTNTQIFNNSPQSTGGPPPPPMGGP
jgi:HlyD family secretion protein